MNSLLYYISLPFIYFISLLPFPVLYWLSDGCFYLVYYVLGYRKRVVFENLRRSFPQKTEVEIEQVAKNFYRYFCDLFLETFKTLTISKTNMLQHCSLSDESLLLLKKYADDGQSVLLVLGHKGNWEWAGNSFSMQVQHQLYVIYHPLANRNFDQLMYKMRSRFGTKLIEMEDTFKEMLRYRNELSATAFIADQTPQPKKAHWMMFLNQETPVFLGVEKIALKMRRPILFVSVQLIKRGYYQIVIKEENIIKPSSEIEGTITERHTKILEQEIIGQPYTWLWTHRRWKHNRTEQH